MQTSHFKRPWKRVQSVHGIVRGKGSQKTRSDSIDLGLQISRERILRKLPTGTPVSTNWIAAFCGCSASYIQQVELSALKKLRHPAIIKQIRELF